MHIHPSVISVPHSVSFIDVSYNGKNLVFQRSSFAMSKLTAYEETKKHFRYDIETMGSTVAPGTCKGLLVHKPQPWGHSQGVGTSSAERGRALQTSSSPEAPVTHVPGALIKEPVCGREATSNTVLFILTEPSRR